LLELQTGIRELTSLHYGKEFTNGVLARKRHGSWRMEFGLTVIPNSAQRLCLRTFLSINQTNKDKICPF